MNGVEIGAVAPSIPGPGELVHHAREVAIHGGASSVRLQSARPWR